MKSDFRIATGPTSTVQTTALCDGIIDAYGYTVGVPNADRFGGDRRLRRQDN